MPENHKIAPVKGAYFVNIESFCQRHDARIYKVQFGVPVLCHNFMGASYVVHSNRFELDIRCGECFEKNENSVIANVPIQEACNLCKYHIRDYSLLFIAPGEL